MKITKWLLTFATVSLLLKSDVQALIPVGLVTEVTTTDDSGAGSLRQAIANAVAGETITFKSSLAGQAIVLTSGELLINKSLTIQGLGANRLAIDGNAALHVFHVKDLPANATVNISDLLITNGGIFAPTTANSGGGILFEGSGTLNLDRCEIAGNEAYNGGGLYVKGSGTTSAFLSLTDSSIADNAGLIGCGAYLQSCTAKMLNCTISGNYDGGAFTLPSSGGGIRADLATVELENCTVVRNKLRIMAVVGIPTAGGGICVGTSELKLRNTIVAENEAYAGRDISGSSVVSLGHNLIGIYNTALADSDQVGLTDLIDPKLSDLQHNGGPTRTHALLDGSPALDTGDDAGLPQFDQRGAGYPRKYGAHVDIGAFEVQPSCGVPIVTITGPAAGAIYPAQTPVTFTGSFDNADGLHTAQWNIDGNLEYATVDQTAHTVSDTFAFRGPGVYSVQLTVANACGNSKTADSIGDMPATVVIYDPSAGFVTGGGWINSPAGAYAADTTLTGKAQFAFVSKYNKGATTPTGETSFQFKVAGVNFASQSYDWLVVSGARAQYKGTGTVNGASGFAFMLTAVDGQLNGGGGTDKFRMKIWNSATSAPVYDNQMGADDGATPSTVIGGGSIIIHK